MKKSMVMDSKINSMYNNPKVKLVIQLCNKIQPLLPEGIDYKDLTLEYKGEILSWRKILYRICERQLKTYDTISLVQGHIQKRYFDRDNRFYDKDILWEVSRSHDEFISWYDLSHILQKIFDDHRENLKLWRQRYKEYTELNKEKYKESHGEN